MADLGPHSPVDDDGGSLLWGRRRESCNINKCSSKLTFVKEIQFLGGVAIQPCELGHISVEAPFFRKPAFFCKVFSWYISNHACSPTYTTERTSPVFHGGFINLLTLVRNTTEAVFRKVAFTSASYQKAEVERC